MIVSDRLKYARDKSGLTLLQVKDKTGIAESSLSDFENSKREPSLSQLHALATTYRRPTSFFLETGAIPPELVLWRQRPETGAGEIESRFLELCGFYHNLEVWTDERLPAHLPEADTDRSPQDYSYTDAEGLARIVRNALNLGDRPALSLLPALEEDCGVKVFHLDFEPSGAAASSLSDGFGAGVLLNRANVRRRRNFDLAHELFHLLTWRIFRQGAGADASLPSPEEEKLATCFARNLLMPTDVLRVAVHSRTRGGAAAYPDLFDIARQFDVSVEALVWQLSFVGLLNVPQAQSLLIIERAKALAPLFEERAETRPFERPQRYCALAIKALRCGEISVGRFAQYMGTSREKAMKYVDQEYSGDEEIPVTPA